MEEEESSQRHSSAAMDTKPSAKGKIETTADSRPKVKKKRKSPAVPWKKPKDMPKRPLSAYNLFFKEERERILSAGPEATEGAGSGDDDKEAGDLKTSKKVKHGKTSGVGFSNLTKKIAIRWQQLDKEGRAPYEKRAAKDKKRYDEAVLVWRTKKMETKKQAEKSKAEDLFRARAQPAPTASNDIEPESLDGLFGDSYPSTWFETRAGVTGVESDGIVLPTQGTVVRDELHQMDYLAELQLQSPPRVQRPMMPPPPLLDLFHDIRTSEMQGSRGAFPESNVGLSYTRQQFEPPRTMRERDDYAQSLLFPAEIASTFGSGLLRHHVPESTTRHDLFLDPFMQIRPTDNIQQSPSIRAASRESFERLVDDLDDEAIAFMTSLRFP
jgi:hypothetical protein